MKKTAFSKVVPSLCTLSMGLALVGCPMPPPETTPPPQNTQKVVRYEVTDLGTLGGLSSEHFHYAQALSNTGYITGNSAPDPENPEISSPFRYEGNGPMENIGLISGSGGGGRAISDDGTVVGVSTYDDGNFDYGPVTAFRSIPGQALEDLGRPDGFTNSEAYNINKDGLIVGVTEDADFSNGRAFVYSDARGFQLLTTLGGSFSAGRDISDSGVVVGFSRNASGDVQGFIVAPNEDGTYPELNPTLHAIPTLGGDFSNASKINEDGVVMGASRGADGIIRCYLYRRDLGIRDLGNLPGGGRAFGNGLSLEGDVVGFDNIYDENGEFVETLGWLWTEEDGIRSINSILVEADATQWNVEFGDGINDSGWIAGSGYNRETGLQHALLLKPVEVEVAR